MESTKPVLSESFFVEKDGVLRCRFCGTISDVVGSQGQNGQHFMLVDLNTKRSIEDYENGT